MSSVRAQVSRHAPPITRIDSRKINSESSKKILIRPMEVDKWSKEFELSVETVKLLTMDVIRGMSVLRGFV